MGSSLLEVMAATILSSMLLIPMVKMLIDCSKWSSRIEYQSELLTLAESCADAAKFQLADKFVPNRVTGNLAAQGYREVLYDVRCQVPAERALRGKYLNIVVMVWADLDSDGVYDSGLEPKQDLTTGLAKL